MSVDSKYKIAIWLLECVARLPLPALYAISDVAYFIVYYLVKYRRKTVRGNLELIFGKTRPDDIVSIEKRYYHHLCDCIVETVKLLHISDEEIDRRVEVVDSRLVDEQVNNGRSVVLLLGHYGNWEWVQAIARHFRCDFLGGQIYRPLHDEVMDKVMIKIRSRFGLECIPQQKTVRRLFEIEKSGKKFVIGFISDQRPIGRNLHNWTDFMGQDTPYSVGGEAIGDKVGAAYLYLDVEKTSRGHYRLTFKPIVPEEGDKEPNPYTRTFMKMLEKTIYRAPEYWLWSHKRWKKRRTVV